MRKVKYAGMIIILIILASCSTHKNLKQKAMNSIKQPKTLEEVKEFAIGEWQSISVELRPTEDRTGSGKIEPTFLKRRFTINKDDSFTGIITLFADDYGNIPLMEFEFKGHLNWHDRHPIAEGAWSLDYVLDQGFGVTPLNSQVAAMLNQRLTEGMTPFEDNVKKDILKKAFPMFNIVEGQVVTDYDLIYFKHGLLFMGAKHVDGTPFDKPENRPHQLQIPLERVEK